MTLSRASETLNIPGRIDGMSFLGLEKGSRYSSARSANAPYHFFPFGKGKL
jgi:hypothetical protein